ncbi:MAG: TetR/AcrR family transcriptional regulator [Actinocatenispora sp.]
MSSLRNSAPPQGTAPGSPDEAILTAARESVLQVGVRRTTATEVARRAGISRMTLYRRFGDVEHLIVTLLTREVEELLTGLATQTTELASARERLVATAVLGVEQFAADPLLVRIIDLDPEMLLPYLLDRTGASHHATRGVLGALLADGHADGSIRPLDDHAASWVLVLILQAFVFGARLLASEADPAAVRAELHRLLDGYLRP